MAGTKRRKKRWGKRTTGLETHVSSPRYIFTFFFVLLMIVYIAYMYKTVTRTTTTTSEWIKTQTPQQPDEKCPGISFVISINIYLLINDYLHRLYIRNSNEIREPNGHPPANEKKARTTLNIVCLDTILRNAHLWRLRWRNPAPL